MTKISKKAIWIIVIILFVLAAFVGIMWGSEGGKQWNTAKWFNYWGKGAPIAVTATVESQEAAQVKTVANAGLTHDSDYSTSATAEIKRYDKPEIEVRDDCFYVTTSGVHGRGLRLTIFPFMSGTPISTPVVYTDNRGSAYDCFQIPFSDLPDGCNDRFCSFHFQNIGMDEYKDSLASDVTYYVMHQDMYDSYTAPVIEMNGTIAKIPFPSYSAPSEYTTLYYEVIISPQDGSISNTFLSNATTENPLFSVVDSGNDHYINIDMTQLSFIDQVLPVCYIRSQLYARIGSYIYPVLNVRSEMAFSISKLSAPQNVTYSKGTLSWNAVTGAEGYAVFSGDDRIGITTETSLNLIYSASLDVGTYTLRVRALGNIGSALAASEVAMARMTPYNAGSVVTQLVALTLVINGDSITKLVPYGSTMEDYLYEVIIPGKEFGGWFYDDGYSVLVDPAEKLYKDTTIYVRLSDKKVTERPLTWWDKYHWWVIGGAIALGVAVVVVGAVLGVRKDKQK